MTTDENVVMCSCGENNNNNNNNNNNTATVFLPHWLRISCSYTHSES